MKRGVLARWAAHLPLTARTPQLTLGEGDTPLIAAPTLARDIGCAELWLKFEGQNPTGSFKDRGMVVAVAKAVEAGAHSAVCASTGNTSASAAAYCAAAGVRCNVVVPEGKVALGKLAQAVAHGARILVLRGNFDAALSRVREIAQRTGIALLNSVNPHRIEGQKTAAFEVVDELGDAPDYLFLPVGNAGNITAYWKGFREYQAAGRATRLPRMVDGRGAPGLGYTGRRARDHRNRHSHRQPRLVEDGSGGPARLGRALRRGHRCRDPGRLPAPFQ